MKLRKKIIIIVVAALIVVGTGVGAFASIAIHDSKKAMNKMYKAVNKDSFKADSKDSVYVDPLKSLKPVSFLLMGVDTGSVEGRSDRGRSDTTLVVTINPLTRKTTILSMERDVYTQIVGHGTYDKYNTAYAFGGAEMAINTTQQFLNIPIDHYIAVNMNAVVAMVDQLGGIDVDNPYAFSLDGVHLEKGPQHLNGYQALQYARYRHEDPESDYGRQRRTRDVVVKILDQLLSVKGVSQYKALLDTMSTNVTTDLTWDDMLALQKSYTPALKDVDELQVHGVGTMKFPGHAGVSYQVMPKDELLRIQNEMRASLGLDPVTDLSPNLTTYESAFGYTPNYDFSTSADTKTQFNNPNAAPDEPQDSMPDSTDSGK
ncbi:MAG: LCP family protein [Lactobacillales bacterium]|jgi:LCP family protein required for cell wall assembly|nr:LCP family protein [Lactobacillales bacterium]